METQRLILREFVLEDASKIFEYYSNEELQKSMLTIPQDFSVQTIEEWITNIKEQKQQGGAFTFALVRKEDNLLVGCLSLVINKEDNNGEISFWVGFPFWKHGYCTESVTKIVEYAFEVLQLHKVWGKCSANNVGCSKVFEKSNMQYEGLLIEQELINDIYEDVKLYGIINKR